MAKGFARRRMPAPPSDPWKRVRVALAILAGVMAIGVVGYRILGLSWFDALYQTAITVTTVGFGEVGSPDQIDDAYRGFTLFLVFVGVSGALYTLGVAIEALVEGSVNDGFRLRKEQRMIESMSNHIVIAGAGRVGRSIAQYAQRHDAEIVVIDRGSDTELPELECPVLEGDATDDAVLLQAGIERAGTLIAALDSDADNVYVTLSARALNSALFIVARTNNQANEPKFFHAGADRVVNPHQIGGSRMGAVAMHPTVAEFLDEVLHDESHDVEVGEVAVSGGDVGKTIGEVMAAVGESPIALAVRGSNHEYVPLPPSSRALQDGDVLIVVGSRNRVRDLSSGAR